MALSSRANIYKDDWQRRTRRHGASLRWQRNQAARLRRRQDARNPEFTDPRQWEEALTQWQLHVCRCRRLGLDKLSHPWD